MELQDFVGQSAQFNGQNTISFRNTAQPAASSYTLTTATNYMGG